MNYRREIDGLRAVAVLPVILFHAGFAVFSGGYIGVDVFFVISGYLITTILIKDREEGRASLLRFYERRARRILPALFVVLAVTIPLAWMRMPPHLFEDYARSLMFAVLFISNVHFWEFTGYFATDAELKPLLHTWSLAIEEQYYLLFPLLLMALGAFRRFRFLIVFGVLAALSLALSEWGWRNYPDENFFFTFSRFWELLAGSICAVLLYHREIKGNNILAALGLGLIVYSIFFYTAQILFPSLYTLVPVVGAMLIILFATPETLTARLLSLSPFVGVGLISYSAYLWHQPLFSFARIWTVEEPQPILMATLAGISLVLAYFTWAMVEQPFRRKEAQWLPKRAALFIASLVGIAAFAGFGQIGIATAGFKSRLDQAMIPYIADIRASFDETSDYGGCFQSGDVITRFLELCDVHQVAEPKQIFGVIGDSHSASLLPAFDGISAKYGATVVGASVPGCPPLIGVEIHHRIMEQDTCRVFVQRHAQTLKDRGADVVFLAARWSLYTSGDYSGYTGAFALSPEGESVQRDQVSALAAFQLGLTKTIEFYTQAGIKVILVAQVPGQKIQPLQVLDQALLLRLKPEQVVSHIENSYVDRTDHDVLQAEANRLLQAQASASDLVYFLSLDEAFLLNDRFIWLSDGKTLYGDDNHLSVFGADRAGDYMMDALMPILVSDQR